MSLGFNRCIECYTKLKLVLIIPYSCKTSSTPQNALEKLEKLRQVISQKTIGSNLTHELSTDFRAVVELSREKLFLRCHVDIGELLTSGTCLPALLCAVHSTSCVYNYFNAIGFNRFYG